MDRKGFTLVELLAVLVVLAVILAVTIPAIGNIIENARRNAFESNVKFIIRSIDQKRIMDRDYIVTNINVGNMENDLELSSTNYEFIVATIQDDEIYIDVVGKNKWEGLEAHGTLDNLVFEPLTTPSECFTFDSATGTISNYDYENPICSSNVVIPAKIDDVFVQNIGVNAFSSKGLTSVIIPKGVTTIKMHAFYDNLITNVVIPNSVTSIDSWAFFNNKLTNIIIPDSMTAISDWTFGFNQLTSITLPNTISTIGMYSFGNNQLENVTIPNSVISIGDNAFILNELSTLIIPNSVTTIGEQSFYTNKLTSITIPNSVTNIGAGAFNYNLLPDEQAFIYARNGDGSNDYTTLVSYGGLKKENITIPNTVAIIENLAFHDCKVNSITIPSSVTTIGEFAFRYNNIISIVIPSSVVTIEDHAFNDNDFTSVTIEGVDPQRFNARWTTIGFPAELMP